MKKTDIHDLILMGYIKGAVGIKGWVKVKADTEHEDGLLDYPVWYLGSGDSWREYHVEEGKVLSNGLQVKFQSVLDRNAAELLRSQTIAVPKAMLKPVEEGEYYWSDLIGMKVENPNSVGFGEVIKLMETGAHDILVVQNGTNKHLIPFVKRYILSVSLENQIIVVDWESDFLC